jgi:hypothetical protein
MLRGLGGNGSDLLGRTEDDENAIFSGLNSVEIDFYNYKNTMIQGLSLGIKGVSGPPTNLFKGETAPDSIELPGTILDTIPFSPTFELLVPGTDTFKILKTDDGVEGKIDFSIAVTVNADLNYPIAF